MKTTFIKDITTEQPVVQDFFLVKSVSIKTGSTGKQYLDLIISDKTGEVSGKKWDIEEDFQEAKSLKAGDIIKLRAQITEWNKAIQLKLTKFRKAISNDNLDNADFVQSAPEASEEMFDFIVSVAESFDDDQLRELCVDRLRIEKERLLYYPAATRNHHALLGGLLYHMKRMLIAGDKICEVYTLLNRSLLLSGVIMHDMEKLNEIMANELGLADEYSFEGNMLGHLVLGVRELDREMRERNIDREKAVMLQHMVLSHHYEPEFGSPKRPLFPEAEVLHYLDVMDAKLYDMEEALKKTEAGEFSEKVWTLDGRRIYKRKDF